MKEDQLKGFLRVIISGSGEFAGNLSNKGEASVHQLLLNRGFIEVSGKQKKHVLYRVTEAGKQFAKKEN